MPDNKANIKQFGKDNDDLGRKVGYGGKGKDKELPALLSFLI
jgi:hypothetical protein